MASLRLLCALFLAAAPAGTLGCSSPPTCQPRNFQCPVGGELSSESEASNATEVVVGGSVLLQNANGNFKSYNQEGCKFFCRFPVCKGTSNPVITASSFRCE